MASEAASGTEGPAGPEAEGEGAASAVRARQGRRRFLAPEVVQTSAMDCGPAALKCLLEGFGVSVSYGRLREACQTSVDGTSIDTLEEVARALGLQAEQIMLPVEHVLIPEGEALPAIAVVQQPSGMTHFVVLWRLVGSYVQVMDPGRGRRWVRTAALARELYVHTQEVDAAAVAEFVVDAGFTQALRARLQRAVGRARAEALLVADGARSWRQVVRLDGATRAVGALLDAGVLRSGAAANRVLASLLGEGAGGDGALGDAVANHACARAMPGAEGTSEGGERVAFRGAVLVRVAGIAAAPPGDDAPERRALPAELAAALDEPPSSLARTLVSLWSKRGRRAAVVLAVASLLGAVGTIAEVVLTRPLLEPSRREAGAGRALLALAAVVVGLLALEGALALGARTLGRVLEVGLRRAFLRKLPRLGDRYFGSRPVSDMAERAHLLHRVRLLPALVGQLGRVAVELGLMAAALAWLHPPGAPIAVALFVVACAVPVLGVPALAERDLRLRAHEGSLTRFYLDALLGLSAVRTHGAEQAVAREHDDRLHEWRRAGGDVVRATLWIEAAVVGVTAAGAAALVAGSLSAQGGLAGGATLLVLFLALGLPVQAARLIAVGRQLPDLRNVTLRLIEPLGAPEDVPAGGESAGSAGAGDAGAVSIEMEELTVTAGGHQVLAGVNLAIGAGEHVAIVGPSGAGKSTLAGVLLGFHAPAGGQVRVGGTPWSAGAAAVSRLRESTVWIEPGVQLWNRTLAANVAYGAATPPPPETVQAALAHAELAALAAGLPGGLEMSLGEGGALLSGGEGQRVRFARELVRVPRPRLVLLDEPFRGLGRETRRRLLVRARTRWAGATLLAISHDLEHTTDFPRVVVVEGGRVVEDGEPRALAADPGSRYHALLAAETEVRTRRWSSPVWRKLAVGGGTASTTGGSGR